MALTCNLCNQLLTACCPDGRCGWYTCGNKACEAIRYDVHRGTLLHQGGAVERL